jgi:hypothetical protein
VLRSNRVELYRTIPSVVNDTKIVTELPFHRDSLHLSPGNVDVVAGDLHRRSSLTSGVLSHPDDRLHGEGWWWWISVSFWVCSIRRTEGR